MYTDLHANSHGLRVQRGIKKDFWPFIKRESTRHGLMATLKHETVPESRLKRRLQPGLAAPQLFSEQREWGPRTKSLVTAGADLLDFASASAGQ
jgi:hypothetical protein